MYLIRKVTNLNDAKAIACGFSFGRIVKMTKPDVDNGEYSKVEHSIIKLGDGKDIHADNWELGSHNTLIQYE